MAYNYAKNVGSLRSESHAQPYFARALCDQIRQNPKNSRSRKE
jgi:hypothetical protein